MNANFQFESSANPKSFLQLLFETSLNPTSDKFDLQKANFAYISKLFECNKIDAESLLSWLKTLNSEIDIKKFHFNLYFLIKCVEKLGLPKLVDIHRNIQYDETSTCVSHLMRNNALFNLLLRDNLVSASDIEYLLDSVQSFDELLKLRLNHRLTQCILSEFFLDPNRVKRFNQIIDLTYSAKSSKVASKPTDVFDFFQNCLQLDFEMQTILETNQKLHKLSYEKNKLIKVYDILKSSKVARNRLKSIVHNNLENNYDFESLMHYLKRVEKKNLINI